MMLERQTYYIYENWVAEGHKARIHHDKCPFCNFGNGIHPGSNEEHGHWHGPFECFEDAVFAATNTGGIMSLCKHCNPQ